MKKYSKLFIKSILLTLLLFINSVVLISCGGDDSGNDVPIVDTSIPTSISPSQGSVTLPEGDSITIYVSAIPESASNEVIWSVSDGSIASVENGVITAISEGSTTVYATSVKNSNIKAIINVSVLNKGIELEEVPTNLVVGQSFSLKTKTSLGDVTYESLDTSIATVENNVLTVVSGGTANIKVQSVQYPHISSVFEIKVYNIPTSFSTINKTNIMFIGDTLSIKLTAKPSKSLTEVVWTSNNESVIAINEDGELEAISEGVALVKATSTVDPNVYFEREITVKVPAESVEVTSLNSNTAYIGETIQLQAQVYPLTVENTVTWRSPDESVATVDENGLVTIVGFGEVTIFANSTVTTHISGSFKIIGLHELIEEEEANVRYIITGVGEDASTSININYHADNTKTYIEYTLADDPDFVNAEIIIPEGKYLEELSESYESPFVGRNVYSAEINGLTPGTKYIYRVNDGDGNVSDTYHFTTAEGKGNDFSFLWLTDNHYHDAIAMGETYLYAEEVIKQAQIMRPDLGFVFDTGDMIDRGGSANIWDLMFSKRMTLKDLPLVGTTGNHELYINGTGQTTNRFHAAYNALPKNGCQDKVGTSCYFFYNDVLFILFETVHPSSYNEQLKWLDDILRTTREENSARLIIMGTHKPVHSTNASYMSQDRDPNVMALCDKYSVDLVLTGHYHSQEVTPDYYEGEASDNPLLGTNYMIGKASRLEGDQATGYIIDVIDGNKIKVTRMNHLGKVVSTWEFNTKKEEPISEEAKNASKEKIFNSLTWSLDETAGKITFNWSKLAYGNVSRITIEETLRGVDFEEAFIINEAYTKLVIDELTKYYDGVYKVTFYFNDGTVMTKDVIVKHDSELHHEVVSVTNSSATIKLQPANKTLELIIKQYDVYVNGEFVESIKYLDGLYPLELYTLNNLQNNTEYKVEFKAKNASKEIMFVNDVLFTTE